MLQHHITHINKYKDTLLLQQQQQQQQHRNDSVLQFAAVFTVWTVDTNIRTDE
jgi:hypothetical protein